MSQNLKIAIQKGGRLLADSLELLRAADLSFPDGKSNALLSCQISNFPAELLFLRDDDIPQYVNDGVADAGIVGLNVVNESLAPLDQIEQLGFGRCRISIAVPRECEINSVTDLGGKRIATSHPNILRGYLKERGITAEVVILNGSVELAPSLGIADAIFDIVSSGGTLIANNLKELATVLESEAILIANPNLSEPKVSMLNTLRSRLRSVSTALKHKLVALNAPKAACKQILEIIPSGLSPVVQELSRPGWCAIQTALPVDELWEKIEALKLAGAQEIRVSQIEQLFI